MQLTIRNQSLQSIINQIPSAAIPLFIAGISLFSLMMALIAQYGFNLRPCDLCMMQRVPFVLNIALGITAYFCKAYRPHLIGLSGIAFLVNSVIAFFHSGVERKWWQGLTGCSTPDMSGSIDDILKRIQETDVVRCDEIPWSFMGLSMANYNVPFCLGLAVICFGYLYLTRQQPEKSSSPS